MRTWVKITIAGGAIIVLAVLALAGTGAYYFFRHLNRHQATEADARREFDTLTARFTGRPPLVEIVEPKAFDIRVNRLVHPQGRRGQTLKILSWDPHTGELMRADLPLWLTQFTSVNLFSHLGVMPSKFSLTAEDLKRYGPGIVVDYRPPGAALVLMWIE